MALTHDILNELCAQGFGPLALTADRAGWAATFDGRPATVRFDGPALQVSTVRDCRWPAGDLPKEEIEMRIAIALRQLELTRDDLCAVRTDRDAATVTVSAWIDPDSSTIVDLARTVRTTVALGDLAARALDQVRVGVDADVRARAASEAAVAAVEQARQALLGPIVPTPTATAPSFTPTHEAPAGGLRTWSQPDPGVPEGPPLPAGVALQLIERRGAWARVARENGQSCWVDGRKLF